MPAYKAELLAEVADAEPQHERRITLRFLASPSRIFGSDRVEGVELVRNELVDEGGMVVARADRRHRGRRGRPGAALGRLPRPAHRRSAVRRAPRRAAQRRRPHRRPRDTGAAAGSLHDGLDQARAVRRHRHQQEVCARDGRRAADGLVGGCAARAVAARGRRRGPRPRPPRRQRLEGHRRPRAGGRRRGQASAGQARRP